MSAYRERPAVPQLAGRLACVWASVEDGPDRVKRIVPDGCIDLIWSSVDGAVHVAGPDTAAFGARLRRGEQFAGVRFRPGTAAEVLGLPAFAVRDSRVPLAEVWGTDADRIAELVAAARDRPRALERLVAPRVLAAGPADRSVAAVVRRVGGGPAHLNGQVHHLVGGTPVSRLAAALDLSQRSLLRRCQDAFGYGPKTLQRILRFQRALRQVRAGAPLAEVAYRCGYADQAHLTREVRALAGVPPSILRG